MQTENKKKIGNILTSYSPSKFPKVFNVTKNKGELVSDIPTLVIGLEESRSYIGPEFSILQKTYNNDSLFWTYKKTERRYEYEDDTEMFYKKCLSFIFDKLTYLYINLPLYRFNSTKKIIYFIDSPERKLCFLTRNSNFLFIYSEKYNTVFGISLSTLEYCGISKKKIVSRVKKNRSNKFIYDTSYISPELRQIIGDNTHYILPLYDYFA